MQSETSIKADTSQLIALANESGLISWNSSTIVKHSGPDALDLLHRLTTKELLSVGIGRAQRTVLTSAQGRVIDTFLVVHVDENELLLVSDSQSPEKTISAIDFFTIIEDAELEDLSSSLARISLVGPTAGQVVHSAFGETLESGSTFSVELQGQAVAVAHDTSRGVDWVDLIVEQAHSDDIRSALLSAGAASVDGAHFEHFRITSGIPGSDAEYGVHSNPIEAGLLPLIDFDKGCYVGQEVIARLDAYDKVQRNLRVLESEEPLEVGAKLEVGTKPAGVVTSASTLVNTDGSYLSLALVRRAFVESGTQVSADQISATVR